MRLLLLLIGSLSLLSLGCSITVRTEYAMEFSLVRTLCLLLAHNLGNVVFVTLLLCACPSSLVFLARMSTFYQTYHAVFSAYAITRSLLRLLSSLIPLITASHVD